MTAIVDSGIGAIFYHQLLSGKKFNTENMMNMWTYYENQRKLEQQASMFSAAGRIARGDAGYAALMGGGFNSRAANNAVTFAPPQSSGFFGQFLPFAQAQGTTVKPNLMGPATTPRSSQLWPFTRLIA